MTFKWTEAFFPSRILMTFSHFEFEYARLRVVLMLAGAGLLDHRKKKLRDWMLCLLRFAITQAPEDQTATLVLASELDMRGGPGGLTFFQRTSVAVCHAIMVRDENGKRVLRQYMSRIEEPPLRNAFAAAIDIEISMSGHRRKKLDERSQSLRLWRGLRNP